MSTNSAPRKPHVAGLFGLVAHPAFTSKTVYGTSFRGRTVWMSPVSVGKSRALIRNVTRDRNDDCRTNLLDTPARTAPAVSRAADSDMDQARSSFLCGVNRNGRSWPIGGQN